MLSHSLSFAIAACVLLCIVSNGLSAPTPAVQTSKSLPIEGVPQTMQHVNSFDFVVSGSDDVLAAPSTQSAPTSTNITKHTSAFDSLHPGKVQYSRANFVFGGECSFRLKRAINLTWVTNTSWVSIASNKYWKGASCGMCVAYQLNGAWKDGQKIHYGIVVDECKGCSTSTLQVYNVSTPDSNKPVNVVWRPVQCDVGSSAVQYAFQGSNRYFIKVAVTNTRVPVKLLEYKVGDKFIPFNLTTDAYWTAKNQTGFPDTLKLRLTSMTGKVVTEMLPVKQKVYASKESYIVVTGHAQFPFMKNVQGVN